MRPYQQEMNGIVGEIWSSMLGLEVLPDEGAVELTSQTDAIMSRVDINGNWRGRVTVVCDDHLATQVTSIMFGSQPEVTTLDMIEDALGELTNMTSGGFKLLLPNPCSLSIPCAYRADGTKPDENATIEASQFGFRCLDRPFVVTIVEEK